MRKRNFHTRGFMLVAGARFGAPAGQPLTPTLTKEGNSLARRADEAGQQLFELALMLPLLAVLLVGGVEFGELAYAAIEVSNAAKAAAQYGAQNRATAVDTNGMTNAAQQDASYFLTKLTVTVAQPAFCICSNSSPSGPASACSSIICTPPAHVEQILTVTTQAKFSPSLYLPWLGKTFTLNGSAVQKVLDN